MNNVIATNTCICMYMYALCIMWLMEWNVMLMLESSGFYLTKFSTNSHIHMLIDQHVL